MARRSRSRRSSGPPSYSAGVSDAGLFLDSVQAQRRDPPAIASARPEFLPAALFSVSPRSGRYLLEIEDRRTFHPERYRNAAGLRNQRHRLRSVLIAMGAKRPRQSPRSGLRLMPGPGVRASARVAFRGPQSVVVCVRRRQRREVLWALRRAGRGAPRRRPRRNAFSSILCRRS